MTEEVKAPKDFTNDINTAMAMLPANPFVVDIIGRAFQIAATNHTEEDFDDLVKIAPKVIDYAIKTSAEGYFKYQLVAGFLLAGVQPSLYEVMDQSGNIKAAADAIASFIFANGWKERWVALFNAAKDNRDYAFVLINLLNHTAEQAMANNDIPSLLGLAYIEVSLRKSAIDLSDECTYPIYNHFMGIMQNKANF